ncbi:hypothetical protein GC722_11575 [Auraticoccus sp. F435]|uniref:SurA N-terminal domain-containing protein n=1 Tax=Auraticoccus cholistanensis TaxID=2656650 RepID=A0A6A9UYK9_9ACTN|nr:hypothetical protein [Auraticoccus cholistanensis]MVA76657.1 hypothetical protein [Auraticoccus cholistanensis]
MGARHAGVSRDRRRAGRLSLRVAAVAVAGGLALAGCGRAPSTAAQVGGTTIGNDQVDTTVAGAAQALGARTDEINERAVLASLIQGAVVDEMVEQAETSGRTDLTIAPADREAVLQSQPQLQALQEVPEAAPLAESLVDFTILQQRMGSEAFQQAFLAVPVEVNPRWGSWQPGSQEGLIGTGSLSVESYTA